MVCGNFQKIIGHIVQDRDASKNINTLVILIVYRRKNSSKREEDYEKCNAAVISKEKYLEEMVQKHYIMILAADRAGRRYRLMPVLLKLFFYI